MTLGFFPGGCFFKITLMFIDAVQALQAFFKVFLIVFTYDCEQTERVQNE